MEHTVISPVKANSMYWLGRYTERIYLELHLLRRCFDMMIDGNPDEYLNYLSDIGNCIDYPTLSEARYGLVHDSDNPVSILSCMERANDNAILLRDEITSGTLAYIQMGLEKLRRAAQAEMDPDVEELQKLTDWMLAFWGSIDEKILNERTRRLLMIGRLVERMDIHVRFKYKFFRIEDALVSLRNMQDKEPLAFDRASMESLTALLTDDNYAPEIPIYKEKVLYLLGKTITL